MTCLLIAYDTFVATVQRRIFVTGSYGSQILKYLHSGPLQKKFANHSFRLAIILDEPQLPYQ